MSRNITCKGARYQLYQQLVDNSSMDNIHVVKNKYRQLIHFCLSQYIAQSIKMNKSTEKELTLLCNWKNGSRLKPSSRRTLRYGVRLQVQTMANNWSMIYLRPTTRIFVILKTQANHQICNFLWSFGDNKDFKTQAKQGFLKPQRSEWVVSKQL